MAFLCEFINACQKFITAKIVLALTFFFIEQFINCGPILAARCGLNIR
jgi:hypothetical protein